ncbi:DUF3500 domain-containing protein [Aestuariibacter sp. GS-14]|uniref:DUF3500 domain-containing protein n=1 Tax=Aestuariibacter sp. GS-14 TaxID=2590670 RepID=UPI00112B4271|nr:DUF3500 domain-containing protein [Aestuariibacter sp. GS-14]TPV59730.1 DUF3500 domain-containing protein [Aestuariibacter sp. GS-14]
MSVAITSSYSLGKNLVRIMPLCLVLMLTACGSSETNTTVTDSNSSSSSSDQSGSDSSSGTSGDSTDDDTTDDSGDDSSADDTSDDSSDDDTTGAACSESGEMAELVCKAEAFIETLSTTQQNNLIYDFNDSTAKTTWSNLPSVSRNGLRIGSLSDTQLDAALAVMMVALTEQGFDDLEGLLAADDYLVDIGGGSAYGSANYYIAFIGEPSVTDDWMLQFGGHHMAFNITYIGGTGYPVPMHEGVEPKASFEINSSTYAPLKDEGDALVAMFEGLTDSEFNTAYLTGEWYSDVLVGPDNGNGTYPSDYPTGSDRKGVLVSDLTAEQQALVTAAISTWVNDYPANVANHLLADYTSEEAFADTYIAFAGSSSSTINVDSNGTYMRIDGPRIWLELVCQNGVIVRNQTHYHTIFRDKSYDYGNSL